jgi:hypothetical protein
MVQDIKKVPIKNKIVFKKVSSRLNVSDTVTFELLLIIFHYALPVYWINPN